MRHPELAAYRQLLEQLLADDSLLQRLSHDPQSLCSALVPAGAGLPDGVLQAVVGGVSPSGAGYFDRLANLVLASRTVQYSRLEGGLLAKAEGLAELQQRLRAELETLGAG